MQNGLGPPETNGEEEKECLDGFKAGLRSVGRAFQLAYGQHRSNRVLTTAPCVCPES